MKPFSLLIKPASADCNLRCDYCFYLEKAHLYPQYKKHRMETDTLDWLIKSYMATAQPQYAFAWQGGEPLLMGLNFYQRVVALQQRHGASGASVANHIQTNGLLISTDMAHHFARYNFLVGISLDGPTEVHDRFRRRAGGDGSHHQVMKKIGLLVDHQVKINILSLITSANVQDGEQLYRYLRDNGLAYHQYIPCVEFDKAGKLQPYAITGEQWGDFLCQVFDEWIKYDSGVVSIRYFDALLNRLTTGIHCLCHMEENCCQYLVVEYNGDVYPCDFFVNAEQKLGNVMSNSWEELQGSSHYDQFGAQKSTWSRECDECRFLSYCAADCLKHRLSDGEKSPQQKSWLCQGYRQFLDHALPSLKKIALELRDRQAPSAFQSNRIRSLKKVGRNAPCPCGSGLKFKKCCVNSPF